jgi:MFS transporter, ACS family, hexuronate transporter
MGMAAAFSPNLATLILLRALLGVGESFNWPCALRVTAAILPPKDRSLGNGIFNSGAAVGAVLTPVMVTLLTARYGWRTAFFTVGTLGFVWVAVWLTLMGGARRQSLAGEGLEKPPAKDPDASPSPGMSARAWITFGGVAVAAVAIAASGFWWGLSSLWNGIAFLMIGLLVAALALPRAALKGAGWAESLGEVVRLRRFWILVLVSISINICWHFLVNWLPTYFGEDLKLAAFVGPIRDLMESLHLKADPKYIASGLLVALTFLAADVGNLGGGALSRYFAGRGMTPLKSRVVVMAGCTVLISGGAWVGVVGSDTVALILIGLMAMGTAAFMANYFSFTQEVSPRYTGLVVGILGGLGNLFVARVLALAGEVKDVYGSFTPIFVLVGLTPFVGLAALVFGWGEAPGDRKPS